MSYMQRQFPCYTPFVVQFTPQRARFQSAGHISMPVESQIWRAVPQVTVLRLMVMRLDVQLHACLNDACLLSPCFQ
jgi:hypothetical protein